MAKVVATAKTKNDNKWLSLDGPQCPHVATYDGPIFHYRCVLTVGAISGPFTKLELW